MAGNSLLYHRRNEEVLELKVDSAEMKLAQCKHTWLNIHVTRMEDIRYPKSLTIDLSEEEILRPLDAYSSETGTRHSLA